MFFISGKHMLEVFSVMSIMIKAGWDVRMLDIDGNEIGIIHGADGDRIDWVTNWGHGFNAYRMSGINRATRVIPTGMIVRVQRAHRPL